jgi:YegS/Rv2252/BmrU family lipid kinase
MGGDGLTGAVAGELRDGAGLLAVLPGGRGNDFARKLGVGGDPVAACELIAAGRERRVDLAEAGGRAYLGILSAGLDSDANAIANATRLKAGTLVYAYGALRALAGWRAARWTVTLDGERRSFDGYSVAVANSGVYGSGMFLVPDARLDDGELDVVLSEDIPKRRYLANLPRVFKGTHVNEPGLHLLRAREVAFEADRPFTAYADGDPIADLPVTVRVLERTLRVLAP